MTTTSTVNWISSLPDAGIATDLGNVASSGTLTYSGALQILQDIAARGTVTQAEVTSLQTIANHLNNGLATSTYVASIFDQMVLGSPENALWTGGQSASVALGDLAAGTAQTQINELIGKWFLGTDLPNPVFGAGTYMPSYATSALPLLGPTGAPVVADVNQGGAGDCVLCSSLIDLIVQHPAAAAAMVQSEGNGIYGVRFYLEGNQSWVTVNSQLPVYGGGGLVYAGADAGGPADITLWASLVEKAYAQLASSGEVGLAAVNSYNNIWSVPSQVFQAMTGCSAVATLNLTPTNYAYQKTIAAALAAHDDVEVWTPSNAPTLHDASGNITLVGDHAFAVVGYDSGTGDFVLRNPWGYSQYQYWDTQFEMSLAEMASVNASIEIDNSGSSGPLATGSDILVSAVPQQVVPGQTLALASLFKAVSASGTPIAEYGVTLVGAGVVNLNGAANLATTTQTAQGEIVVSAADLSKLTISGVTASVPSLEVAGYDGQGWSAATTIVLSSSATSAGIAPTTVALAPGQTVSLSSLFHVSGQIGAQTNSWYDVTVPVDGGTINLNGAQNGWPTPIPSGSFELNGDQLGQVTYTAPSTGGQISLQFSVYSGSNWSGWQGVTLHLGSIDAATAVHDYANAQFGAIGAISDSAANIFANLDALQPIVSAGALTSITLTDQSTPSEILTAVQLAHDGGALALVSGAYLVDVGDSAANVSANIGLLAALAQQGHLGSITFTGQGVPTLSLSAADYANDGAVLHAITGNYALSLTGAPASQALSLAGLSGLSSLSVSDSVADVSAGLDGLQSLAATGKLSGIALSDGGVPTLSTSLSQLSADAKAIAAITGNYTLEVTVPEGQTAASTSAITAEAGHALIVDLPGTASQWTIAGTAASLTATSGGETFKIAGGTELQFGNTAEIVASQTPAAAGGVSSFQVASLYAAVFDRVPDAAGLSYYEGVAATQSSIPIVNYAQWFLTSPEYTGNSAHGYAATVAGDEQFVIDTYSNLLHRSPGTGDVPWYELNVFAPILNGLASGTTAYADADLLARATLLADFSQSLEFKGDVSVTAQTPASAQHWLLLI